MYLNRKDVPNSSSSAMNSFKEPYQLIIDKNMRSKTKRIQDDTREELNKVLHRVEHTLDEYEKAVHEEKPPVAPARKSSAKDYLIEAGNLQDILMDKVAKFKYKQKITVLIVSHVDAIQKRTILLEQINDFFNESTSSPDQDQLKITEFDFDLEEVKEEMDDALETAKVMGSRLEELNENIIQYLIQNFSAKQSKALIERTRKKLEKSLKDTKDEVTGLNDKIGQLETDLSVRDEKIVELTKQLEAKTLEMNSYLKKLEDGESDLSTSNLNLQLTIMSRRYKKMEKKCSYLQSKLTTQFELAVEQLNAEFAMYLENDAQEQQQQQQAENENANSNGENGGQAPAGNAESSDMTEDDLKELEILKYKYETGVEMIKKEYEQQLDFVNNKLKSTMEELDKLKKSGVKIKPDKKGGKKGGKKGAVKGGKESKAGGAEGAEATEEAPKEENEAENAEIEKQNKLMEELEAGGEIEDLDLTSEEWVNVNPADITKRYEMLRRYANHKINKLKESYDTLNAVDREKIDKLKKQYYEHKKLWETEKLVLLNLKDIELEWDQERSGYLDKAEIAMKLQSEAQDTAEKAIRQLEEFIAEDARLDRENADNTIQILRERSRTMTSLSMKNEENDLKDDSSHEIRKERRSRRLSQVEGSHKIQISLTENNAIKFPSKAIMEQIIEYINFGTEEHKFTLVVSHSNSNSRPQTRGSAKSPVQGKAIQPVERHGSAAPRSAKKDVDGEQQSSNAVDQILTKVLTDDETMIAELRNAARSRNSLRSKHLEQLEENKASLNELKAKTAQKLLTDGGEQEFPDEDDPLDRSMGSRRDLTSARIKAASEAILSRVTSSKGPRKSSASNLLSHPITLEYLKTFDIVNQFKRIITSSIPPKPNSVSHSELFGSLLTKLNSITMTELDQNSSTKVVPQIINMTTNIDNALNEIQIVFTKVIDELVNTKYELVEKEHEVVSLKQTRPLSGVVNGGRDVDKLMKEKEELLVKKETQLGDKEKSLIKKEENLGQTEQHLNDTKTKLSDKEKELDDKAAKLSSSEKALEEEKNKLRLEEERLKKLESEINLKSMQVPSGVSSRPESSTNKLLAPTNSMSDMNQQSIILAQESKAEAKFNELNQAYQQLETKYDSESKSYQQQIDKYKKEINTMSETIDSLRRSLAIGQPADQLHKESSEPLMVKGQVYLPPINQKPSNESIKWSKRNFMLQVDQSSIMFSRLDAIQNEKRLRGAVSRGRIAEDPVQNANSLMERYVSLQATRLALLVKRYISHLSNSYIQNSLETANSANLENFDSPAEVGAALETMKKIEERRKNKYLDLVRSLREKRLNVAYDLTERLDDVEKKSGIFLIKPIYSYQGVNPLEQYLRINKLTKSRSLVNNLKASNGGGGPIQSNPADRVVGNSYRNASNYYPSQFMHRTLLDQHQSGSFINRISHNNPNWNAQESLVHPDLKKTRSANDLNPLLASTASTNSSRLAELDVNRMIIPQNQISVESDSKAPAPNLRSYYTISRSYGSMSKAKANGSGEPLPPIRQNSKNKPSGNEPKNPSESIKEAQPDSGEIIELASIGGTDSVPPGDTFLSRDNTDMNKNH